MIKCKLSDVCVINPKDKIEDMSMKVSFVPMQSVYENGNIDTSDTRLAAEVSKGFTSFAEGDVLMAKITPCMENGKGAIATGLCNKRGFGSTEFFVIRPDQSKVSSKWIYYYTTWKQFRLECERNMTGSAGQKRVPKSYLENREICLPSLGEQDCAVQKFDRIKKIINMRQQQLQKLDELVKARFVEMFGDIDENVPLSYYIMGLNAGKSLAGEEPCFNKVLKTSAVTYDNFDRKQVKNLPLGYKPLEEHRVRTGDVIISRMNTIELVGAAAYVWDVSMNTYLPDRLWRAEVKGNACPIFVWQLLIQSSTKESIRRIASGTSGSMKNISKAGLLGIQVKKVDQTIQKQFSAFVEQVYKTKLTIQKSLDKMEVLQKALMQKYFG